MKLVGSMLGFVLLMGGGAAVAVEDCNGNGTADSLDLAEGKSLDCNSNGIPDECESGPELRFATWKSFWVGSDSWSNLMSCIVEDLDGDGIMDIAAGCNLPAEIWIIPGLGGRKFGSAIRIPVDFRLSYEMVAGDVDGDADPDLLALNEVQQQPTFQELVVLENQGRFDFSESGRYRLGAKAYKFVVADFDGDGDLDIAVSNMGESEVSYLRSRGDGTFHEARSIQAIGHLRRPAAGDLDGDRLPELIVTGATDRWLVGVMRNLGGGEFAAPELYQAGPVPVSVAIGDLDHDGDPDLVAGSADSVGIGLLFNDGRGRFPEMRLLGGTFCPAPVFLGDLNGDGWLDISASGEAFFLGSPGGEFSDPLFFGYGGPGYNYAVSDIDGDGYFDVVNGRVSGSKLEIVLIYSRGDGTLESPRIQPLDEVPNSGHWPIPTVMRGGDLDGDGDVDLAVAKVGPGVRHEMWILKNAGDGSFNLSEVCRITMIVPADLLCRDLDGDGDLDLAACGGSGGGVCALLNRGDGTFGEGVSYLYRDAGRPLGIAAADLDADGDRELITANYDTDDVAILWNLGGGVFGEEEQVIKAPEGGRYVHAGAVVGADLDGDGDDDFAVLHARFPDSGELISRPELTVFLSDRTREFKDRRIFDLDRDGASLAVGDMTGDGVPDLVVACRRDVAKNLRAFVVVLQGRGDGDFVEVERVPFKYHQVSLWDLDRDGDLDVVGTGGMGATYSSFGILLNRGGGRLDHLVEMESECETYSAVADDLTGDGKVDLAILNFTVQGIAVYVNESEGIPGPCGREFLRGDADGGGSVDLDDAVRILSHLFRWDAGLSCRKAGDVDDDGTVGLTDAVYLINYLYLGGSLPREPFGRCGEDPTEDALDCALYMACP